MIYGDKSASLECLKKLTEELAEDTERDLSIAIVVANTKTGSARIWGMNMDEDDMFELLTEAAEIIGDNVIAQAANRTLN
jgi:hypothetical protein